MTAPTDAEIADRLRSAELTILGQFNTASNATLLMRLGEPEDDDGPQPASRTLDQVGPPEDLAVYKPRDGEAPLWDFPSNTLYRREVAAYEVSRLLGWDLVPVTVVRDDAPYGVGSLQRFIRFDPDEHYFALVDLDDDAITDQLRCMCVYDMVINNADRKGGHVLKDDGGSIWGVDHGVAFHEDDKLRTVIWHFIGEPIPADLRADVARFADLLESQDDDAALLRALLSPSELGALILRADVVSGLLEFPQPTSNRPYPWPMV